MTWLLPQITLLHIPLWAQLAKLYSLLTQVPPLLFSHLTSLEFLICWLHKWRQEPPLSSLPSLYSIDSMTCHFSHFLEWALNSCSCPVVALDLTNLFFYSVFSFPALKQLSTCEKTTEENWYHYKFTFSAFCGLSCCLEILQWFFMSPFFTTMF